MPVKAEVEPIEHFLIPKHFIVSKEQAAEFLKKYNLGLDQLPKILASDQAISEFKPERNDIVKIVRN
ncbi:unnamed protein product, partial [marine sediment metagenome]